MQIQLDQCGKSFNRHWLYRNLNLTLQSGEQWAFLGANGSGKSTLMLMLTSQVWPTEGKISWTGNDGTDIPSTNVFRHIALASPAMEVPEEFNLSEIISMQARIKPFQMKDAAAAVADICSFDKKTFQKPVSTFSSGMKQRVKLCLAALADTPVLLLDEPLTNLDTAGAAVYERLREEYCNNRLLVIASNREDEYRGSHHFVRIGADSTVAVTAS